MESKFQRNIFESDFDSFEFDDEFLMKMDSDLKNNKINEKLCDLSNKCSSEQANKSDGNLKKKGEKTFDIKAQYYDLPLFIEDLNESDFFENNNKKIKNNSKVTNGFKNEKKALSNGFMGCLSPIQGPKSSYKMKLSSSTPLKPDEDSNFTEKPKNFQKKVEDSGRSSHFDFLEADLFDDWGLNEINREANKEIQRETVTFSQALKLIEEAESGTEARKESLDRSVDLLTGEFVDDDVRNMLQDSFDLSKSDEKKNNKESCTDIIVIKENFKQTNKPSAAQKLNFDSGKNNYSSAGIFKENNVQNICFNSDDDFDFITQEFLKKPKKVLKCTKMSPRDIFKAENWTPLKDCDLNESTDEFIGLKKKKKKKNVNMIESDTTEDSISPEYRKQSTIKAKKRGSQEKFGREFIESEAEVSDEVEVSSDEAEEEGEYDQSFLDEESYFTQNCSADMTAKYLESVKSTERFGGFKIPPARPYDPNNVFSQIPENNTDYEINSFCVNEVEEDIKTDLSDLEVAEKILEMDRKKRKKKRNQKLRKFK